MAFKIFNKEDSSIKKISVYSNQSLIHTSEGVSNYKGYSSSLNEQSSSNWYFINSMYYNNENSKYNSYIADREQIRILQDSCSVVTLPAIRVGVGIKKSSFQMIDTWEGRTITIADDGKGNIYDILSGSDYIKGNIFYAHGLIVMTDTSSQYLNVGDDSIINYRSTHYIYEHSYNCKIGKGELNGSTNPTFVYGNNSSSEHPGNEILYENLPTYITTVGLYDNENRLLAIARMARPLYNDPELSMNLKIKFDF